jgi:hypothetical protein
MALAETADGGIAGHRTDGRESVRYQRCPRARSRSGTRGLTTGVASSDDNDVE